MRSFIVLAEELHFGRAAQQCGISQPAMSRLLSDLETDLGVKLLDRTSREVSLTPAGRGFLESARKAIAFADMAVRAAKAGTVNGIDRLTVGMVIGTAQPAVGRLIARFKQAHPETLVTLCQLDERSIGSALAEGKVDAAIAWEVSIPKGLNRRQLGTVPMSVLVQADHELAQKSSVSLAELAEYPIILPARDRQPVIYDTYQRSTAAAGFTPKIAIDVSTIADTLAMVAGGVGIGNAPLVPGLQYPGIVILAQKPRFEFDYKLVWAHSMPAIASLLSCISEESSP
ncbi:MAG: LysR family transcriptional regulator [Cyanobacteria bacterium P01_H01_bin.153]